MFSISKRHLWMSAGLCVLLCRIDVADAQLTDQTQTPNAENAGIFKSLDQQIGAGVGNIMAASLGIVTPFCSCSAVPLFIGFVQAGVPLGVTFSFLIAAPMVNEVALTLLFALFGW